MMWVMIVRGDLIMNILIFGGTGFVGKQLIHKLKQKDNHLYIVSRRPSRYQNKEKVTFISYDIQPENLPYIDLVINLAGESLFGYWTEKKKNKILQSRIKATEKAIQFIQEAKEKPQVFINASAVGFYGTSEEEIFTEETRKPGRDFLASVVTKWEATAKKAEKYKVRTVFARFGLILGQEGSLPLMSLPVKLFLGGKIGKGKQWISWIHIEDVIGLLMHCIEKETIAGPVNFTAPYPVQNSELMQTLAKVLGRPYYFTTPAPLMKLVLGEMSDLITKGQFVLPKRAQKFDYTFKYNKIEKALKNIFKK